MSSVTVGLTRMARVGMKRPRASWTSDRSSRAVGAVRRLTPPASSRRASTMRRLGQGRTENVAACGALQCRRGEAPKAAFRLSPTLAADNGQRINPIAASARINATAQPNATARRMLCTPPCRPRRATGRAVGDSYRESGFKPKMPATSNKDNSRRGDGPERANADDCTPSAGQPSGGGNFASPTPDRAKWQFRRER